MTSSLSVPRRTIFRRVIGQLSALTTLPFNAYANHRNAVVAVRLLEDNSHSFFFAPDDLTGPA